MTRYSKLILEFTAAIQALNSDGFIVVEKLVVRAAVALSG